MINRSIIVAANHLIIFANPVAISEKAILAVFEMITCIEACAGL